jgi:5,10-methylenetetrahydromethanopterin reductase
VMRCGVLVAPPNPVNMGALAASAEGAGFDLLAFADSQSLFRELYVSMAVAAQATARIKLVPGVSNLVTRHVAVTASAMATVDELSGGRAILALGTGDSAVYNLGERAVGLADMEEAVRSLRHLFAGERVEFRGRQIHVGWSRRRVPIYMAAEGPRTLELAGMIADGVIVGSGLGPSHVSAALERLATGAERSGRSLADLDVWFFAKANLGSDDQTALDEIRMALAASANHAFRFTKSGKDLPEDLKPAVARLQQEYAFHQHEQVGETRNAELVEELGLIPYLADRFAVVGIPATVVSRLLALEALGVEQVLLTALVPDPPGFIDLWRDAVAPRLAAGMPEQQQ